MMAAAVAAGAVAAATQAHDQPERTESSTVFALAVNRVGYPGVGGNSPATGTLPMPEVLPVARDTLAQDINNLAKGQRIAEENAAEIAAAEQAAAEAAQAAEAGLAAAEAAARAVTEGTSQLLVATGDVVMPTVGRITSGFGARWGTTHYGIDIANAIGTPIYATTDGLVIESGPANGFGMWVRLLHADGTISVYGHINESLVTEGESVAAGEQIATMGNRGYSTGPHLHFEIWLGGVKKINPLSWLRSNGINI